MAASTTLRFAGILALATSGLLVAGAVLYGLGSGFWVWQWLPLEIFFYVVELALSIAGGILALVGRRAIAPWLLVAAFLFGEVGSRLYAAVAWGGVNWPWSSLQNLAYYRDDFGDSFAYGLVVLDVAFFTCLAAAIVGLLAFFTNARMAPVGASTDVGEPLGKRGITVGGSDGAVPSGWYADPNGMPVDRFWDGTAWGDATRPRLAPVSPQTYGTPASFTHSAPANGMGTAALVLGIGGFFCMPLVASVLAIIFGRIGMTRAGRGLATNGGVAKAGFILGIISLVLGVIGLIIWVAALATSPSYY